MNVLTIKCENVAPDKETQSAQKQWEQHGTVTDRYLRQALGDISEAISIFPSEPDKKDSKKKDRRST
jgi:hypothetical protein